MDKFRKIISFVSYILFLFIFPHSVSAASSDPPATITDLEPMVQRVVGVIIGFAGIILFVTLLLGGFQLITSSGDPNKVAGAWKTITFAVVGLGVILLSVFILRFIYIFTGVNVLEFKIVQ